MCVILYTDYGYETGTIERGYFCPQRTNLVQLTISIMSGVLTTVEKRMRVLPAQLVETLCEAGE
jgi:hypothetical protein